MHLTSYLNLSFNVFFAENYTFGEIPTMRCFEHPAPPVQAKQQRRKRFEFWKARKRLFVKRSKTLSVTVCLFLSKECRCNTKTPSAKAISWPVQVARHLFAKTKNRFLHKRASCYNKRFALFPRSLQHAHVVKLGLGRRFALLSAKLHALVCFKTNNNYVCRPNYHTCIGIAVVANPRSPAADPPGSANT